MLKHYVKLSRAWFCDPGDVMEALLDVEEEGVWQADPEAAHKAVRGHFWRIVVFDHSFAARHFWRCV